MRLQILIESLLPQSELSFGVGGIEFFQPTSVAQEQAGYEGPDWRRDWLVVAHETCCGDPIFIDQSEPGLPVYTAMIGMGGWTRSRIAPTWQQFVAVLEFLQLYTKGREHPVGLAQYPLTPAEEQEVRDGLLAILGQPVAEFWGLLMSPPAQ